jgi:hypothetical protein
MTEIQDENHKKAVKLYYQRHKDKIKEKANKWFKENPERHAKTSQEWRDNNPDKYKKSLIKYRETHKNEIKERKLKYAKLPHVKLRSAVRSRVWSALKGKKNFRNIEDLLGYTINNLMDHLEKQFQTGMTWDNYGKWHVDHKIPESAFNFKNDTHLDFKRCWALDNLQPLWAEDNLKKHKKLNKPFQPMLQLGA